MALLDIFKKKEKERESSRRNSLLLKSVAKTKGIPTTVTSPRTQSFIETRRIGAPTPTPKPSIIPRRTVTLPLLGNTQAARTARAVQPIVNRTQELFSQDVNRQGAGILRRGLERELAAIERSNRFGNELLASVPRGFVRAPASIGIAGAENALAAIQGRSTREAKFTPTNQFEKAVFGEEPIYGFEDRIRRTEEDLGGGRFAKAASLPLVGVGLGLDVSPLATESASVRGIRRTAERLVERYGDDAVRILRTIDEGTIREIQNLPSNVLGDVVQVIEDSGGQTRRILDAVQDIVNTNSQNVGRGINQIIQRIRGQAPTAESAARIGADEVSPIARLTDEATEAASQERSLIQSARESDLIVNEISDQFQSFYRTISNDETLRAASKLIDELGGVTEAAAELSSRTTPLSSVESAASVLISEELSRTSQTRTLVQFFEDFSRRATEAGRAVQALALLTRLTPAGALRFAQGRINQARQASSAISKARNLKISPEAAEAIQAQARRVQELTEAGQEGTRAQLIEVAKLNQLIDKTTETPRALGVLPRLREVSALQNIALLLSPPTFERNIIGNVGFGAGEAVADVVGAGADFLASLATGRRSKGLVNPLDVLRGGKRGLIEGSQDVALGLDTGRASSNRFNLGGGQVFAKFDPVSGTVKPRAVLGQLEKALNFTLRVPDRVAFEATFESQLREIMRTVGTDEVTQDLAEVALYEARRRTFQDANVLSTNLNRAKRLLNLNMDFGLGEAILKFAQTPGALLMRGIEFTPLGMVSTLFDLAKLGMNRNLIRQVGLSEPAFLTVQDPALRKVLIQRRLVEGTTRSAVGTLGLAAPGYYLQKAGIVQGRESEDKNVAALEEITGQREYTINLTALKRHLFNGLQGKESPKDGDLIVDYNWLQPLSFPFAMGVEMAQAEGSKEGALSLNTAAAIARASVTASQSIVEQPIFSGLQKFSDSLTWNDGNVFVAALEGAAEIPATFIPSFVKEIREVVDPTIRDSWSDDIGTRILTRALNRIPGLSDKLPARVTTLGEDVRIEDVTPVSSALGLRDTPVGQFEGALSRVFNPAIVQRADITPATSLIQSVRDATGSTDIIPKVVGKTQSVAGGDSFTLTQQQKSDLQRRIGQTTNAVYTDLAQNPDFQRLSPTDKEEVMSKLASQIRTDMKYGEYAEYLGADLPENTNPRIIREAVTTLSKDDRWKSASPEEKGRILQSYLQR